MRRILIGDLLMAAAVIGAAADPDHSAQLLLQQADAAHRFAKRFGRPHPAWGNGSLMARALAEPARAPLDLSSQAMLMALSRLTRLLALRRAAPPSWLCPPAAPYDKMEPNTEMTDGRDQSKTIRPRSGLDPRARRGL